MMKTDDCCDNCGDHQVACVCEREPMTDAECEEIAEQLALRPLVAEFVHPEEIHLLREMIASQQDQIRHLEAIAGENHQMLVKLLERPQGMVAGPAPKGATPWQRAEAAIPILGDPGTQSVCGEHGNVRLNAKGRCPGCLTTLAHRFAQEERGVPA